VGVKYKNNAIWKKALRSSADPQRAEHFFELLAATSADKVLPKYSAEQARILASLLSGSKALSEVIIAHPDRLDLLAPEPLKFPRRKQGLGQEVNGLLAPLVAAQDFSAALRALRQFKQHEQLRIGARDLARIGNLPEVIQELSDLADVCLNGVWRICRAQLEQRFGRPHHQDTKGAWQPTSGCVLGLGKLGGHELNYSSDVDVMFVYTEEGNVFKDKGGVITLTNHQFFNRLSEAFIAEVQRMTPEGMLYRVDLRLRPEGDAGPLSRSLSGYENYYSQWGQTWERMMLLKARGVAGEAPLAAEFLEMIQPFRYPRSINTGVLREVAAMKDRIENEVVKTDELDRNVKLGRGGIREIEFIVQAMQLLHGGRQPFLQGSQTLPGVQKLAEYELLTGVESKELTAAYVFLRDVEHRLQMENNLQTHTIPTEPKSRERLARLMSFRTLKEFEAAHKSHRRSVRRIFDKVLRAEGAPEAEVTSGFPRKFEGVEGEWKRLLAEHSFKDLDRAYRVLREFVEGPGFVHVSPRTSELAYQLLPRLFRMCREDEKRLSDPDRVVTRLDSFIGAYGARATLFELWNSNPAIFELLVRLFDRSEFLAELAIRTPDLVDELVISGRLRQRKSAEETLRDLRHGLEDADQYLWLRRYHQAELMRIGLRDILGLADFEQYLNELSSLADACLQYALEVVMRKHKIKQPPFAIVGLGKLGGSEIDYGSDLDILFVAESKARKLTSLAQWAVEVMDLISHRTEQGIVFQTDARLRPDGEKGLLVNTNKNYEDYYRQRAQLWEIQSLTRVRTVAGDPKIGSQFQKLAAELTNFRHPANHPAAYTDDWREKIHHMRMRIERERTPRGKDDLAIKTGRGGLMDAEFIAQALCLENVWQEPNTLRALERAREAGVLAEADELIKNYRQLRQVEGILRRWSYEGETVLPDDPAPYYRVSVRCGFESPEAFRTAVAKYRDGIRKAYECVFLAAAAGGEVNDE
jgi:glutamate-ammonia-ligase adenylyltransferase